ncbi:hypothetical protein Srubr_18090 [Streptomyces rubradiris]|uniref:Alpha-amylase n=1 Tax=Streptomyces rubradiris TaxID=285531 RepID=A0ABQ3R7Y6_STRRR|nr:hypothetical protein Srubr_18090 [Streptomyces rubradiris]
MVFTAEKLAYLKNYGEGWGYLSGSAAGVFVDNHDTERNGSTLSYKSGANYTLANVFMLAWPYGAPDVNSGYEWSDADAGPPNGGRVDACGKAAGSASMPGRRSSPWSPSATRPGARRSRTGGTTATTGSPSGAPRDTWPSTTSRAA